MLLGVFIAPLEEMEGLYALYKFPIEFFLPDAIPSSLDLNTTCALSVAAEFLIFFNLSFID
jgi:hypothetical protein